MEHQFPVVFWVDLVFISQLSSTNREYELDSLSVSSEQFQKGIDFASKTELLILLDWKSGFFSIGNYVRTKCFMLFLNKFSFWIGFWFNGNASWAIKMSWQWFILFQGIGTNWHDS